MCWLPVLDWSLPQDIKMYFAENSYTTMALGPDLKPLILKAPCWKFPALLQYLFSQGVRVYDVMEIG